jgi:hypothetical protein
MSPTEQIGKIVRTATMHAEADSEILQAAAFSKAMAKQRKHGNRVYLRDRAAEEGGKKITSGRSLVCGHPLLDQCWCTGATLPSLEVIPESQSCFGSCAVARRGRYGQEGTEDSAGVAPVQEPAIVGLRPVRVH